MNDFQCYKNLKTIVDKALIQSKCLTINSVYKAGISSNLLNLIDNYYVFPQYLFLWVDLNNEEDLIENAIIEEINFRLPPSLKINANAGFVGILNGLKTIIKNNNGIKIVLIVENSQELFVLKSNYKHNIKKLLNSLNYSFVCFYLLQEELPLESTLKIAMGDLYSYFSGNIFEFPLFNNYDISMSYEKAVKEMNLKNSNYYKNDLIKLSGGHVGLLRALIRAIQSDMKFQSNNDFLKFREIEHIFSKIWSSFLEETQTKILQDYNYTNDYISKLNLKDSKGKWFSPLWETFTKNLPSYLNKPATIEIQDLLSYQELLVYSLLTQNINNLVTKEDIAKLIWKDDWVKKYSEWAIAQVVSQIRKKLSIKNVTIKASKGEGYILLNEVTSKK